MSNDKYDNIIKNNYDNHNHNLYTIYEEEVEEENEKYTKNHFKPKSFKKNQVTNYDHVLYKNDTSINPMTKTKIKNKQTINCDFIIKYKKDILHIFRDLLYDIYIRKHNNNKYINTNDKVNQDISISKSTQYIFEQFIGSIVHDIQYTNKLNEIQIKNKNIITKTHDYISKDIQFMLKDKKANTLEEFIHYKKNK